MQTTIASTQELSISPQASPLLEHRILIVEDDVDLMNVIVRIADSLGPNMAIDWATDTHSALKLIQKETYGLVLVDYFLKGSKNGFSLVGACRDHQPDSAFAMMSSMSLEDFWKLPDAIHIPLLRKPFTPEECSGFIASSLA